MSSCIKFLIASLCVGAFSFVQAQIPDTKYSQGISYISGGVGEEESQAILAESKQWPILLELSQLDGGRGVWIFGAQVKVLNEGNQVIFNAIAEGPYILINLPAGNHLIEASYQGVVQKKTVSINPGGNQKISIFWR